MNDPHDPVEASLRDAPYLDDGGFTEGVLEALPPRRPDRRGAILAVSGVAAAILGAATLGEPLTAAVLALGAGGASGVLLLGAAVAAAAGARRGGAR
jgi:hypothetical protein